MGYVPPPPPDLVRLATTYEIAAAFLRRPGDFRPNLDRFGLPRDYETYLWATYGEGSRIPPERRVFLYGVRPDGLPAPNMSLLDHSWR